MLRLPDCWLWDFWLADDGATYHCFFLKASRALGDPDRRHHNAVVGHATSPDLITWREVADALAPSDEPAFDDLATWTGSVVARPGGGWRTFHTGIERRTRAHVQRISWADSADLVTWTKATVTPLEADPQWYEALGSGSEFSPWRDPWVFRGDDGVWHMLVTASAAHDEGGGRGVVGHATSPDLQTWTVREPLSRPGSGFGELEVLQVAEVEGRWVAIFSCLGGGVVPSVRPADGQGGVWALAVDGPLGPFAVDRARRLTDERFYSGRLVRDRAGDWKLLAFRNVVDGAFAGELSDPMPVVWEGDRLVVPGVTPADATGSR